MYGAIIGDLAGSIYEFNQTKKIENIKIDEIIIEDSFYSDDTILTIAILDSILNNKSYDDTLRYYINKYTNYRPNFKPYFASAFSPNMIKWAGQRSNGKSKGNGALMRISPVGYLFDTKEDIIKNAYLATIPSHNTKEAIECATKIALMIYYFRCGMSKNEVYKKLGICLEYKPFTKFNVTCSDTMDNCLYALYYSNCFSDAIRKVIYMGGDTDTNAAIVGSLAEALYGIDDKLKCKAEEKIPQEFVKILRKVKNEKEDFLK